MEKQYSQEGSIPVDLSRPYQKAWGSSRASYPVALDGVHGLLAGRGAGAHAVSVLAVGGVPVALPLALALVLVLILVLPAQGGVAAGLPREGEGAGPAGGRGRDGAPERARGATGSRGAGYFLNRAAGRQQALLPEAGGGQLGSHGREGSWSGLDHRHGARGGARGHGGYWRRWRCGGFARDGDVLGPAIGPAGPRAVLHPGPHLPAELRVDG